MDPRALEVRDFSVAAADKCAPNALQDEACSFMSRRPESIGAKATNCGDKCDDKVSAKSENVETPEVKAAFQSLLEKTRGVDPVIVSDSLNLFGDLAAAGRNVEKVAQSFEKRNGAEDKVGTENKDSADSKVGANVAVSPETAEPHVAEAYTRLLQRGFNPTIIADVINVAKDVAAIAMSPQGKQLFQDFKTLVTDIRGK